MNKPQTKKKFHNNAMSQAMGRVVERVKGGYNRQQNTPQPVAVNRLQKDGIDHINIHPHARTKIGEALSTVGNIEFRHPQYGKFTNTIGLVMWLCSVDQPDSFRRMPGKELLKYRKGVVERIKIPNYRTVVLTSTWMKIQSSPSLMNDLKQTALNFDYYFYERVEVGEPIRVRAAEYEWLCPAVDEMRKALIEGREPDFTPYLTNAEIIQQRTAAEAAARNMGDVFKPEIDAALAERKQNKTKKNHGQHKKQDQEATKRAEISDCSVVDYRTLTNPITGQPYGDLSLTKIDGKPMYGEKGELITDGLIVPADIAEAAIAQTEQTTAPEVNAQEDRSVVIDGDVIVPSKLVPERGETSCVTIVDESPYQKVKDENPNDLNIPETREAIASEDTSSSSQSDNGSSSSSTVE